MSATKEQILAEVLRLAKAKQGKESTKCVELTATTSLGTLPKVVEKDTALQDVATALTSKYDITFPTNLRSLGTIDDVAQYIVDNIDP